jgi:hypothetical protein
MSAAYIFVSGSFGTLVSDQVIAQHKSFVSCEAAPISSFASCDVQHANRQAHCGPGQARTWGLQSALSVDSTGKLREIF